MSATGAPRIAASSTRSPGRRSTQLSATLSGTFARHEYEFSPAIEGGETITEGNDVDTAPRELLRAAMEYRPLPKLSAEAEWLKVGEYWLDASNAHRYARA